MMKKIFIWSLFFSLFSPHCQSSFPLSFLLFPFSLCLPSHSCSTSHLVVSLSLSLLQVLEFMWGGELAFYLKAKPMKEATAQFYAANIMLGLEYLHNNKIIHRDLKPQNILISVRNCKFNIDKIYQSETSIWTKSNQIKSNQTKLN